MATTSYGFTLPTAAGTKISAFADVVADLATKLDQRTLINIAPGVDLNTQIKQNDYIQTVSTAATAELNYPAKLAGVLEVQERDNQQMIWQRYTSYGSNTVKPRMFFRGRYNGQWYPWQEVNTGESGSALTWMNQHGYRAAFAKVDGGTVSQLIYGDTGLRNITSSATGQNDGEIHIRRTGFDVTINFSYLASNPLKLLTLPAGFRPQEFQTHFAVWDNDRPGVAGVEITSGGALSLLTYIGNADASLTFKTNDPWPNIAYGTEISAPPTGI